MQIELYYILCIVRLFAHSRCSFPCLFLLGCCWIARSSSTMINRHRHRRSTRLFSTHQFRNQHSYQKHSFM